ncbi:protealysin inhibitor emfourin [Longimycelium tulufanense]|uniref:protealysin inhibitor emfourin n=1 Tax=Longimycelium tulufanense TaxID=907463 RepID=UPI001662AEF7|nr:protealysin inhibitor emfourin [Longimycelium tulufanense]
MSNVRRNVVLLLAVLLGFTTLTATASATPPTTQVGVREVVLEVTGGIAGIHETFEVTPDSAHPNKDRIFTLVRQREFRTLKDQYLPENQCCDFFHYTLTVAYTNGRTKTVETMDGADAPEILFGVIRLIRFKG